MAIFLSYLITLFLIFYQCTFLHCLSSPEQFGATGTQAALPSISSFPDSKSFFTDYVFPEQPVVIRKGCEVSPAYHSWREDAYFTSTPQKLDVAKRWKVSVESRKKEDRDAVPVDMSFHDFLASYQSQDEYLVEELPAFLGRDVIMPYPLQCEEMRDSFLDTHTWFSSGGTKSVVHTDEAENILCIFDGEKELILVDPHKYADEVPIDVKSGSYSSVDVDNVDLNKFPGLARVEYLVANLTAGDCLYIPFKWIHQVRSYNRNLAVNIWWNYHENRNFKLEKCGGDDGQRFDPSLTLDKFYFGGFSSQLKSVGAARVLIDELLEEGELESWRDISEYIIGNMLELPEDTRTYVEDMSKRLYKELDGDGDGKVGASDVEQVDEEKWEKLRAMLLELEKISGEWPRSYDVDYDVERDEL